MPLARATVQWAMVDVLRGALGSSGPTGFEEVILRHFALRREHLETSVFPRWRGEALESAGGRAHVAALQQQVCACWGRALLHGLVTLPTPPDRCIRRPGQAVAACERSDRRGSCRTRRSVSRSTRWLGVQ